MPEAKDDYAVIRRITAGEVDAYEVLIARYRDDVFRIVSGHVPPGEVPTVAHDAFVRAYGSLRSYRPKKPFIRWLGTIAVRTCHDYWRRQYRNRETALSEMSENGRLHLESTLASDGPDPETAAQAAQAARALHKALDELQPIDRMVVTLTHLEEYTVKEAAEMLGLSVANVKIKAFRARKKLRTVLEKMEGTEPQGGGAS